jgi:hypothetical protein
MTQSVNTMQIHILGEGSTGAVTNFHVEDGVNLCSWLADSTKFYYGKLAIRENADSPRIKGLPMRIRKEMQTRSPDEAAPRATPSYLRPTSKPPHVSEDRPHTVSGQIKQSGYRNMTNFKVLISLWNSEGGTTYFVPVSSQLKGLFGKTEVKSKVGY